MVLFEGSKIIADEVVVIPILSDCNKHSKLNSISVIGISIKNGPTYVIPLHHNEGHNNFPEIVSNKIWIADKKKFLYHIQTLNLSDISSLEYLINSSVTQESKFFTPAHNYFYRIYNNIDNINEIIPLGKHAEFICAYAQHLWETIDKYQSTSTDVRPYQFLSDIEIPTIYNIEKNGFQVDKSLFQKYFDKTLLEDVVFSEYKLYTTTGRCSNAFGGINFAALNKSDGSRSAFISRFGDEGILINLDFESFHLRLIADLINYPFPSNISIHEYFGRQYFNKDTLTESEYEESKQKTFKNLYSKGRSENLPDFFVKVHEYSDNLKRALELRGKVFSPYYFRPMYLEHIENSSNAFNYMIQLAETEMNLTSIQKILPLFENKLSKPILYLYDSLLIDVALDERDCIKDVVRVLEQNNKFPIKISIGKNFHEMKRIK